MCVCVWMHAHVCVPTCVCSVCVCMKESTEKHTHTYSHTYTYSKSQRTCIISVSNSLYNSQVVGLGYRLLGRRLSEMSSQWVVVSLGHHLSGVSSSRWNVVVSVGCRLNGSLSKWVVVSVRSRLRGISSKWRRTSAVVQLGFVSVGCNLSAYD